MSTQGQSRTGEGLIPRWLNDLLGHANFVVGLGRFLRHPIAIADAEAAIRDRLARRNQEFISFMKRCVFSDPASPYQPLLREAGWTLADVEAGVEKDGIESVLEQLRAQGVWVSADQYKGHAPLRRGSFEQHFDWSDFDNPVARGHIEVSSGGSKGQPTRTHVYLRHLAERACYEQVVFHMLGLGDTPIALWYPALPAVAGMSSALRYARIGHPAAKWYRMLSDDVVRPGLKNRLANRLIVGQSKLFRYSVPTPEPLDVDQVDALLDWIVQTRGRHGQCAVQSYVSQAVRICAAAASRSIVLDDVTFIVGSEPLTADKQRCIRDTGARVFPRYMSSELGTIGMACGTSSEAGDYHLMSDRVAAIAGEADASGVAPLFYTSFSLSSPKVLLNARIGDRGKLTQRTCGCAFGALGLNTHISQVDSYTHVCMEGMAVRADVLARIVDEVLPNRFGGVSADYQWVQRENKSATSQLMLRIHPRLGEIDGKRVVRELLDELRSTGEVGRLYAGVWESAGSVQVVRAKPRITPTGKTLAISKDN